MEVHQDLSNGYEGVAAEFIARRSRSLIGAGTVRRWAQSLPAGASVLDLGCGSGIPVSQTLIQMGFTVFGVDASPTMIAAFRQNFPQARVACEPVERSSFFGRTFDAAVAWGLMFLLPPDTQADLIRRIAAVLNPGGRFLFTAPEQSCTWRDVLTGKESISLGATAYEKVAEEAGLKLTETTLDEGENHYFLFAKA